MVSPEVSLPKGSFCSFFCSRFLSYVDSVWQARHFQDILRSGTSFCMTGAGHRTLFHPHSRRGTLWTLLKRWQAWIKMRGAFGGDFSWQEQYLVHLDDVLKGSKIAFCRIWFVTWWWFRVAPAALRMPRAHFSWQVQHFVDLGQKVAETWVKRRFFYVFWLFQYFSMLIVHNSSWCAQCFICENLCNICSRNPLVTLCVSDCARCGAVLIFSWLGQPSRNFGCVRWLSLWRVANLPFANAIRLSFANAVRTFLPLVWLC